MTTTPTYLERLELLPLPDRRRALWVACEEALRVWHRQMAEPIVYIDSVVGVRHQVDLGLPARALAEVAASLRGETIDPAATRRDYMEPITALQDDDLQFPVEAGYAYYAIYNLHCLVFDTRPTTELVVLNQAISATLLRQDDRAEIEQRLSSWWEQATRPRE